MTNFEWEKIEKEAAKKKTTVVITVFLLLLFFFVFYKYEILSGKREPVIKEKMMEEKGIKKTQEAIEKKENIYTVKIGPFNDPMLVSDFLDKTGMDKIKGIYKSGGSYYLNIGRINNMDKALLKKDEFIEKGFPAIIEKFDPNIDYDPALLSEIDEIKAKNELKEKEKAKQEEFVPEFTAKDQIDAQKKEGWTIQVAAADSIKSATELKNKLRFTGIESVIINEPPYYKVQIGLFSTRDEALEYSKKLDKNIIPGVYIKKVKR